MQPSPIAVESAPEKTASLTADGKPSYGQILKSSAMIGGSSVVNIGLSIVRTKAMAMLLGPAGVGLMGVYNSIADLAQSIAGMGVNSSGVRQIAEAVGADDATRVARTAAVLRRISIIFGLIGGGLLLVFSAQISTLTFSSSQHAAAVAMLGAAVFLRLVSAGQGALIQGMRRVSEFAKMALYGGLFGTIITILLVYLLGENGIVPSLVATAAMTLLVSWWYSRKLRIPSFPMSASQGGRETAAILKLGFAFMASGLMVMGVAYVVRIMVLRQSGIEAAGLYQAAWALGGLYVGLVLQSMGADFYPRLTNVATDNSACNRLVNEQAQISLLLAGPGVLATLTLAPLVISLCYSAKFDGAVGLLRWICMGMMLRVITWPMGFIILAKGRQRPFFWTELAWTVVHIGLAWICVGHFGLNGAGMAFFGSYVFHGLMIYPVVRRMSCFRWSAANRRTILFFIPLMMVVFCGFHTLPYWLATVLGALAVVVSGVYSLRVLLNLVPLQRIPRSVLWLLAAVGIAPSACKK